MVDADLFFGALATLCLLSAGAALVRFRGTLGGVLCFAGFMVVFLALMGILAQMAGGWLTEFYRAVLPRGRMGEEVLMTALIGGHILVFVGLLKAPSSADRRQLNAHLRDHPPIACPKCGIEHPPNATRCLNCKTKLPPASEPH